VKLEILGKVPTTNAAVLLLAGLLVQIEDVMPVIVTVIAPVVANEPEGITNVPLDAPIVKVAVSPVAVLAPARLYVTVKVPVPNDVEFTVTVDAEPEHALVAVGDVKLLISGDAPCVTPLDVVATLLEPHDTIAL